MFMNKKIAFILGFLALAYENISGMECNTTAFGQCKTPSDALHKCLQTKYSGVYTDFMLNYKGGRPVHFKFAVEGQTPIILYSANNFKVRNNDLNCLSKVNGIDLYIQRLDQ
jgi:hypothetical protein